jgi:hypothetical protein
MSMVGNKSRLTGATKELATRWAETRHYWNDAKSREFDERFMRDLFAGVDRTGTTIDKLNQVLEKITSDCE